MKNGLGLLLAAMVIFTGAWACNMSTANLGDLKTGKDSAISQSTTQFVGGDTIYASVPVNNNPDKVKVKMFIEVENVPGAPKGTLIPNSVVELDMDKDGVAQYHFPTFSNAKGGSFNVVAEMYNDKGEKKDSKSVTVTVAKGPNADSKTSSDSDDD